MDIYTFFRVKGKVLSQDITKMLATRYAGDLKYGFEQAGNADLFEPFLAQLEAASYIEKSLQIGTIFLWMLSRSEGKVQVVNDIEWAGETPLDVFSFTVYKDDKKYEFVMPKPAGNIALYSITSITSITKALPPPPPPPEKRPEDSIPIFCPPMPSAIDRIDNRLLKNLETPTLLGDVANKLENALDLAGYKKEIKYYAIPCQGFAIVTKLEQINSDGTPKDSDRWAVEYVPPKKLNLSVFLKLLFNAKKGFFRIIVFIVTDDPNPICKEDKPVSRDEAMKWFNWGALNLPNSIANINYDKNYYCEALIYEFEKPGSDQKAHFVSSSKITGRTHLIKAEILDNEGHLRGLK